VGFEKVAKTSEIPLGSMKAVKLSGLEILIANVNGNYYAIGNRCTHSGAELSKGRLEGNLIICPWHKAKFDVTTGKVVFHPKVLWRQLKLQDEPFYEVKVDGNDILLNY